MYTRMRTYMHACLLACTHAYLHAHIPTYCLLGAACAWRRVLRRGPVVIGHRLAERPRGGPCRGDGTEVGAQTSRTVPRGQSDRGSRGETCRMRMSAYHERGADWPVSRVPCVTNERWQGATPPILRATEEPMVILMSRVPEAPRGPEENRRDTAGEGSKHRDEAAIHGRGWESRAPKQRVVNVRSGVQRPAKARHLQQRQGLAKACACKRKRPAKASPSTHAARPNQTPVPPTHTQLEA